MEAKLDFYPRVQVKAIVWQIFIHLLLIMEPKGFWIEACPDPCSMGSSLSLFLRYGLSFARTTDCTEFLSFFHQQK